MPVVLNNQMVVALASSIIRVSAECKNSPSLKHDHIKESCCFRKCIKSHLSRDSLAVQVNLAYVTSVAWWVDRSFPSLRVSYNVDNIFGWMHGHFVAKEMSVKIRHRHSKTEDSLILDFVVPCEVDIVDTCVVDLAHKQHFIWILSE